MPLYVFECQNCEKVYEALSKYDKSGKYAKVECPQCKSKKKTQKVHTFGFAFSNPVGTDKWRNSHDYRFHHNLPNVKKERERAEKASKSPTPYNAIDDLSGGKHFGEVK